MNRDASDQEKISPKPAECSPFSADLSLRNVANGIVAEECVDVRQYESVDQSIIEKIVDGSVFTISFSKRIKQ